MPYSVPVQGRPGHRRSFSNIVPPPSLASTSTTGAFASLGALPTRRRPSRPTFQLGKEDDDDSPDESPEDARPTKLTINTNLNDDDEHGHLPPLRLKSKFVSSFDVQPSSGAVAVPFPRSSPLHSPTLPDRPPPPESRPFRASVSRTASTPILLANGKPLKSSLKSCSSSPNIPFPPQSLVPSIMFPQLHLPTHHQRACSAPATPNLDPVSPNPSASPSPNPQSPAPSPSLQKNVHFPSQEEGGLTTVRVYKRSAKPASLLRKGEDTETETEGESSSAPNGFNLPFVWGSRWNQTNNARAPGYPFPKFGGSPVPKKPSPLADHDGGVETFEIDMKNSSPIPTRGADRTTGNIHFETLGFISDPDDKLAKPLTITGTILVRNISYHKTVAVRYTLDDWNTTNDVLARHDKSLSALPERFLLASLPLIEDAGSCLEGERRREVVCRPYGFEDHLVESEGAPTWDRFRFDISLETYESSIQQRTMWFVGRYATAPVSGSGSIVPGSGKEWWDNNSGSNYRVAFVKKMVDVEEGKREGVNSAGYRRNVVFSAPPVFTPSKPFPAPPQISASLSYPVGMTSARKEHAAASHAALTQRLKKFSFTNYAAPSPAVASSLPTDEHDEVPSSETSTANTSTDSTPLHTPTQGDRDSHFDFNGKPGHDVNANVLVHDDEPGRDGEEERRLSWGISRNLQMQDGHPATFIPPVPTLSITADKDVIQDPIPTAAETASSALPMEIGKDRGRATVERESSDLEATPAHTLSPPPSTLSDGFGVEMGTSPPFSLLAGMEMRNGMFASKGSSGLHWPWGGESKQESKETIPTLPNIAAPTAQHVTTNAAHIRTSSPIQGLSGSLMPPQRKKSHHPSHSLPNKVPTFSIGRTSSSSSRSGSGSSGSGSDTASGALTSSKNGSTNMPNLLSPQPWPFPPQNQLRRVMSPPPTVGSRRVFEIKADDDDEAFSVDRPPTQRPSPPPRNTSLSEIQIPTSPANDAVYQAFVRQWCFAQGSPPVTGSPRKSERISPLTPDVVVR